MKKRELNEQLRDALQEIYEEDILGEEDVEDELSDNEEGEPVLTRAEQEAQVKNTLGELLCGIGIVSLLGLLIGNIAFHWNLRLTVGILTGTITAAGLAVYMYHSVLVATELPQERATGYMKKTAIFRMGIMVAVIIAAVFFLRLYGMFGAVFGMLTLKFSAFLWPLLHKYNPFLREKK